MPKTKKKRGPLSKKDAQVLEAHLGTKTDSEIADMIGRTAKLVAKHRARLGRPVLLRDEDAGAIANELHNEYFWSEIQQQFLPEELPSFEARWIELCNQFGDSIVPTDKMQMVDLIRIELMYMRILTKEKETIEELNGLNTEIQVIEELPIGHVDRDIDQIIMLRTAKNELIAVQGARTKDMNTLAKDKNVLFGQLKATREKRISLLEDSNTTFWDLLKMVDDEDVREREGRHMELFKVAAMAAAEDLSQNTEFEDGTVDRPLLTPETALLDKAAENRPEGDTNADWNEGDE